MIKQLHEEKLNNSCLEFKETRVTSCSRVLMKNGNAVCIAFKTNLPKPVEPNLYHETASITAYPSFPLKF